MKFYLLLRRGWREQWGSQGLEAAGAALAAAIIIAALLSLSPTVGGRIERALNCAAAVLSGGSSCGGDSLATDGATPNSGTVPISNAPAESDEGCHVLCQIGGFFKGVGEGAVDFVKGIWTLGGDIIGALTGNEATYAKYQQLWEALKEDPGGTLLAIFDPIVEDWRAGRYGEAIGRGVFEIGSIVVGDKGLGKLGKVGKVDDIVRAGGRVDDIGRIADDLPDIARAIDRLPCVGFALPKGKGPGLAALLPSMAAQPCTRINVEHIFHGEINRRGRAVGFHHRASIGHEGKARIVPGSETPPNAHGVFQAEVEIYNPTTQTWVRKSTPSSFFPDSWNRARVMQEIREAYDARTFPDPSRPNYWEGVSSSGVRIGGYMDDAGNINTAFPIP